MLVRCLLGLLLGVAVFYLGRITAPESSPAALAETPRSTTAEPVVATTSAAPSSAPTEQPSAANDLKTWKTRLEQTASSEAREEDLLQMIVAWARVDPQAALEYARTSLPTDRKSQAVLSVFAAWAQKDAQAAWAWVLTHEANQNDILHTVLNETGKLQPAVAQQFAASFAQQHPDQASEVYLATLDGVIHAGKYEEAKLIIAQARMPDQEQNNNLVNFLAGQWARYEPEKAAAWVLQMPSGPVRTQALDSLGQSWSDIHPAQAADFAVKLPPGPERQNALKQAVSKWALDDPSQASKWILQFNAHEDFDQAVASLATSSNVMYQNANLALSWAATIHDPALRSQSTTAIVSNWYSVNPAAALNYVNTAPELTADARQELLRVIAPPASAASAPSRPFPYR